MGNTEWDIAGGNFNKPVEFPETINEEDSRISWSLATDPDLQISPETIKQLEKESVIEMPKETEFVKPKTVIGINKLVPVKKVAPKVPTPEVKKSNRINPDALPTLYTAVALVSILMLSSFVVSFSGIYEVSAWTGLPSVLQWLPAFFIDAAILAYTISLVVFKARGESTWRTLAGLSGFAVMSVIANIAHTVSYWNNSLGDYRSWVGIAITAAAPIAVLLASEEITRLAFDKE
jgi:hypothetical protein